jgi:hypothetical protein
MVIGSQSFAAGATSMKAMEKKEMSCGEKMAEKAVLPGGMAKLMGNVVAMLKLHAGMVGATAEGKTESDALLALAKTHEEIGTLFSKAEADLKAAANWPHVAHDMKAMNTPESHSVMMALMESEREMAKLLNKDVARMEARHKKMMKKK